MLMQMQCLMIEAKILFILTLNKIINVYAISMKKKVAFIHFLQIPWILILSLSAIPSSSKNFAISFRWSPVSYI